MHAFQPGAATATVSATTTSAATSGTLARWRAFPQLQVANAGPDTVFVAWGLVTELPGGTLTATTADYPVLAGSTVVLTKVAADIVAVVTGSGTATVYLTPGTGV